MNPLVYIVVRNYNSFSYLFTFFDSVFRIKYSNFKVVLVDDGSTDNSTEKIKKIYPEIEILKLEKHYEYCISLNYGIKYAIEKKAKYVFVINNDTRNFSENIFTEIINKFSENNKLAMISTMVNDFDGNIIFDGTYRMKMGIEMNTATEGYMIKIEALLDVGLFNEKWVRYFEDLDLILRLRNQGYETTSIRNAYFDHFCGGTSGKQKFVPNYYRVRNLWWFIRKYRKNQKIKHILYWLYEYYEIHLKRLFNSLISFNLKDFIVIFYAITLGTIHGMSKKY